MPRSHPTKPTHGLPPPTVSEASFEALLQRFCEDVPARVPTSAVTGAEAPSAFVEALFAKKDDYLAGDRYASIGDANEFNTKIVGVTFEGRQDMAAGLAIGDTLDLRRQPDNPNDPNAIAVLYGALQLGFLRREIARRVAPNMDAGDRYEASVTSLTGGDTGRSRGVNILVRRRCAPEAPFLAPSERNDHQTIDAREVRRALIGDRAIREAQDAVLQRLREGRNTLAIMGTGRGKSFCFQFPAAERALLRGERTIVFYPLRALANDQYEALLRRLGPLGIRVFRANGAIDGEERARLQHALADGSWDLILSTPEFAQYHGAAFRRGCNRVSLVVVDEAHHLYESRHRAGYGTLGEFIVSLGSPQVLALTATAGEAAFTEIRRALRIDAWVIDPTVRANLRIVDARGTKDKFAYLARVLDDGGKAIVYGNSRAETTKIAERLRARYGDRVAFYHAGVSSADRAQIEEHFRNGAIHIITATSAFGEGIDLPDVRDVVLYHLNFDFTEFNQQAGRAGRDGLPATIHLLYGERDRSLNDFILRCSAPSLATLREIYRGMRGLIGADGALRMKPDDIAATLDLERVRRETIAIAVHIFEEGGLVESGTDDDGGYVRFREVEGRVDLSKTTRFAEGEAERESFDRFCSLALSADAATLEQVINRPIFPDGLPLQR